MTGPAVRVLTPPGTGAIATVEIRGPEAWESVRNRFTTASGRALPNSPPLHRVWVGTFGDGSHADEVVVAVKQLDPEPVVEVHCHGGRRVVQWVSELLGKSSPVKPRGLDPWTFLPHALTLRTASILLDQCHGAFDRAAVDTLQTLESNPQDAGSKFDALARYAPLGRHLVAPWRVVIAGEPNVGKSSLVNALAGFQRSIVSASAGTTRDVVSTLTAIAGWPVELLDTAGLRLAVDPIEREGVGRAHAVRTGADLVVWVVDGDRPLTNTPGSEFVVINKIDLHPAWDWNDIPTGVRVSASTGMGIPTFMVAIAARLVPDPPPAGAAVPYTSALADAVDAARTAYLSGNFDETRRRLATCRGDIS